MKINNLTDCIAEYKKTNLNYKLPVMLGLSEDGNYKFADLTVLKHLVLAGQTGSGKSVFENNIIYTFLSLMPNEVEFLLVDMKRVEFTPYNGIPQLIGDVITKSEDFFTRLEKLIEEKEERLKPENSNKNYLYIVAIFETISDLVYFNRQQFDNLMEKLLINAADAKIHVIVSDSRVGESVFTPTIMSLMPTKFCFATANTESSQLIIQSNLGQNLLGSGDVLLKQSDYELVRLQTPWISDEEIEKLIHKV